MEAGQIIIDQSVFVKALISVLVALLTFTAAFFIMSIRYFVSSFDKKIDICNKNVSDKITLLQSNEVLQKKEFDYIHERITNHIIDMHAK